MAELQRGKHKGKHRSYIWCFTPQWPQQPTLGNWEVRSQEHRLGHLNTSAILLLSQARYQGARQKSGATGACMRYNVRSGIFTLYVTTTGTVSKLLLWSCNFMAKIYLGSNIYLILHRFNILYRSNRNNSHRVLLIFTNASFSRLWTLLPVVEK